MVLPHPPILKSTNRRQLHMHQYLSENKYSKDAKIHKSLNHIKMSLSGVLTITGPMRRPVVSLSRSKVSAIFAC